VVLWGGWGGGVGGCGGGGGGGGGWGGSQASIVCIATRYGLDGPGIESLWGREFPHLFRPALSPTQPPVQGVPGLSLEQSDRDVTLTTYHI